MKIEEYVDQMKKLGWVEANHISCLLGDDPADGMHHHIVFIDDGTCPFGGGFMRVVNIEEDCNGSCFVKQDLTSTMEGMSQDILNAAMAVGRRK